MRTVEWYGETCTLLTDGRTEVVIAAERGGKVVGLLGVDNRQWLAQPEPSRWRRPQSSTEFINADMCGWDECAPTILSCRWDDRDLPDHGDLWNAQWAIQEHERGGVLCSAVGPSGPYEMVRRLTLQDGSLVVAYTVRLLGGLGMPFLWALHPQFVAPAGTRVMLGSDVETVVDVMADGTPSIPWTLALSEINSVEVGGCRKVYVPSDLSMSSAAICRPDGATLRLDWDPVFAPYLGLWFDRQRYSREDVIAIEPSSGWYDDAAAASRRGLCTWLEPGATFEWQVRMTLT